jgi:hypothetical protein
MDKNKQTPPQCWWDDRQTALTNGTPIPTLSPLVHEITHAVVIDKDGVGSGVCHWYGSREDAEHTAELVEGRVVPVDSVGGKVLVPPLATALVKKRVIKIVKEMVNMFIGHLDCD